MLTDSNAIARERKLLLIADLLTFSLSRKTSLFLNQTAFWSPLLFSLYIFFQSPLGIFVREEEKQPEMKSKIN